MPTNGEKSSKRNATAIASKKEVETRALDAARKAGVPIPAGGIPGEEPDFRFHGETGILGIEVTELLRPASSNCGIVPVEEEAFHREIIRIAQREYYSDPKTQPVRVVVYFASARGKKLNKREMAQSLATFVKSNLHRATPVIALSGLQVPEGFGSMSIASESGEWWGGECGGVEISDIYGQLVSRISAKDVLVPKYRANLGKDAHVWLLLFSMSAVSRSMPIPYGIEKWSFSFQFDRIFWFVSLENKAVEILKA